MFVYRPPARVFQFMRSLLVSVLFYLLLRQIVHGQAIENIIFITKSVLDLPTLFNVKINGVDYYSEDQAVVDMSSSFTFQRQLGDVVEVVFPLYPVFPGDYYITLSNNQRIFDSKTLDFYIVNQCVSENVACSFKINPVYSFPAGITATISINGQPTIINYDGQTDSQSITVNKGDLINVKMSGTSQYDNYGMNFVTTTTTSAQKTVSWYNNNMATQTLIPSVYFTSPVTDTTVFSRVNVPIVLTSYPEAQQFLVSFIYNSLSSGYYAEVTQSINSNSDTPQIFVLPNDIDPSGGYEFTVKYAVAGEEYAGLNSALGNIATNPPSTITFIDNFIGSSYSAGTSVLIALASIPFRANYMVLLTCGSLTPVYILINANESPQNFLIDDYMYGNNCVFSINYPINSANNPSITVTQPVSFTEPSDSNSYYANEPVRVLPSATASIPDATITVTQNCGETITTYSGVVVNQPFNASPPVGFTGSCTYSSSQSGLYNAASPTVTITIEPKTDLIFAQSPRKMVNSQDFVVKIDSVGSTPSPTVNLMITCDIVGLVQDWTAVTLNQPVDLNFDAPNLSGGPFKCTFVATSLAYNDQTSPVVIVFIPLAPLEQTEFIRENGFAHWILDKEDVINI